MQISDIQRHDSKKMYEAYDRWPEISQENYFAKDLPKIQFKNIDHIVFAGVGGSGTIGDVISSILSKNDIHVNVVKGYLLPKTVDSNTLVITTSVSGNSKEALTILHNAKKSKGKFLAFSSGGEMKKYSIKNKIPYYEIPEIHSPRASFPCYLYSILNILEDVISVKKHDVKESIDQLKKTKKKICSDNLTNSNPALSLAKWISDFPIIYYPWGLHSAAIRFKNSLQENAKMHVFAEDIIESSHNGIVAWEKRSKIKPILLMGKDDYVKTKERWQIVKEFFNQKKIQYKEVHSLDGNILTKLVNLIYLLDYSSIYLAVLSKTDPTPVKPIEFIKSRI
jgi:glucose/mannose-6-phosphate isomerase